MTTLQTTILSQSAVSDIEARTKAATKGPWHTAKRRPALIIAEDKARVADCHVGIGMGIDEAQFNSEFIAHAREDIPALCATVKHLRQIEGRVLKRAAKYCDRPDDMPVTAIVDVAFNVLQSQLEQLRTATAQMIETKCEEYRVAHDARLAILNALEKL